MVRRYCSAHGLDYYDYQWKRALPLPIQQSWLDHCMVEFELVARGAGGLIDAEGGLTARGYGRVHKMKYEAMCEQPRSEALRLCGFLGVQCDEAYLEVGGWVV